MTFVVGLLTPTIRNQPKLQSAQTRRNVDIGQDEGARLARLKPRSINDPTLPGATDLQEEEEHRDGYKP
jgi:hypothetical protein